MGRILAIDYGTKRSGIAVTDALRIIANALETVPTYTIISFLKNYLLQEKVDIIVVGEPKQMDNTDSESADKINTFIKQLNEIFPRIPVHRVDERFTSKMASQVIQNSGLKKKARQNKALIDSISATIILQTYMEANNI